MKKNYLVLLFLLAIPFTAAFAQTGDPGFCTGAYDSTFRHADWSDYSPPGGNSLRTRECRGKYEGRALNLDVWNVDSEPLCIEIVYDGPSGSEHWRDVVQPDHVLSKSVNDDRGHFRIGATPMNRHPRCY